MSFFDFGPIGERIEAQGRNELSKIAQGYSSSHNGKTCPMGLLKAKSTKFSNKMIQAGRKHHFTVRSDVKSIWDNIARDEANKAGVYYRNKFREHERADKAWAAEKERRNKVYEKQKALDQKKRLNEKQNKNEKNSMGGTIFTIGVLLIGLYLVWKIVKFLFVYLLWPLFGTVFHWLLIIILGWLAVMVILGIIALILPSRSK